MDDSTIAAQDQADEEILNYTVSDEALEGAAGTQREGRSNTTLCSGLFNLCCGGQ